MSSMNIKYVAYERMGCPWLLREIKDKQEETVFDLVMCVIDKNSCEATFEKHNR